MSRCTIFTVYQSFLLHPTIGNHITLKQLTPADYPASAAFRKQFPDHFPGFFPGD
jgi:hypothetical protein